MSTKSWSNLPLTKALAIQPSKGKNGVKWVILEGISGLLHEVVWCCQNMVMELSKKLIACNVPTRNYLIKINDDN